MKQEKFHVLIVDDEPGMCRSLQILLSEEDQFEVDTAKNYYEALDRLRPQTRLIITDLSMPGKDGLELLREVKKVNPKIEVIMMTAYSTVGSAIKAIKEGAFEYLIKPFKNEDLLKAVDRVVAKAKGKSPKSELFDPIGRYGDIVGQSEPMQHVYRIIDRAAETDSTVLITGESGTGKELVARAIHFNGLRKRFPLVSINCTALSENLLESELFGHEKGSFSGAVRAKEGKFEIAHNGTLFLDEIGEMSPALQVKLLRVLQEREFERVGGVHSIKVNVRIIAATNRNLQKAIKDGRFREDLFYRFNVLTIQLPSLKERADDISLLINYLLKKKCREFGIEEKQFSSTALTKLMNYDFPGNVRELENLIERAVIISTADTITEQDVPLGEQVQLTNGNDVSLPKGTIPVRDGWNRVREMTRDLERQLIIKALSANRGISNERLADLLGTSRRVIELRLKEFDIGKGE